MACVAAIGLGGIALNRGEHINSLWLVLAAACSYAVGYRFYAKFIAARVMKPDQIATSPRAITGAGARTAAWGVAAIIVVPPGPAFI